MTPHLTHPDVMNTDPSTVFIIEKAATVRFEARPPNFIILKTDSRENFAKKNVICYFFRAHGFDAMCSMFNCIQNNFIVLIKLGWNI